MITLLIFTCTCCTLRELLVIFLFNLTKASKLKHFNFTGSKTLQESSSNDNGNPLIGHIDYQK